jgi:hypothetical protein
MLKGLPPKAPSQRMSSDSILQASSPMQSFQEQYKPPMLSELGQESGVILEGWLEKKSKFTGFWSKVIQLTFIPFNKFQYSIKVTVVKISISYISYSTKRDNCCPCKSNR